MAYWKVDAIWIYDERHRQTYYLSVKLYCKLVPALSYFFQLCISIPLSLYMTVNFSISAFSQNNPSFLKILILIDNYYCNDSPWLIKKDQSNKNFFGLLFKENFLVGIYIYIYTQYTFNTHSHMCWSRRHYMSIYISMWVWYLYVVKSKKNFLIIDIKLLVWVHSKIRNSYSLIATRDTYNLVILRLCKLLENSKLIRLIYIENSKRCLKQKKNILKLHSLRHMNIQLFYSSTYVQNSITKDDII